jgi:putative ABC transport system permease protein
MAGPFNWLSQVGSITRFGILSIPRRAGAVAAAMVGVAGVVAVLVGVLSIAAGFQKAMTSSGLPDGAVVLRGGADTEMVSGFNREQTRIIADAPGLARGPVGALASAEIFVVINLPKKSTGTDANVPLRGVQSAAPYVRDGFKLIEGRMFEPGKNELLVGAGAAGQFRDLEVGHKVKIGRLEWPVVGIFTANGGAAESELWTDAPVLQAAYDRGDTFQSVSVRLASAGAFNEFKDALTTDPRLNVKVQRQTDYYAEQSTAVTKLITTLGVLVAFLMAVGAIFGALNTMYSSVAARTREIATLRALGFGRGAVIVAIMIESLVLAMIGGLVGAVAAYMVFNGFQTTTMNWQSFSQVTFAFQVTPELILRGITWACFIGLVGGLFPAIRAARLPIAAALREL